MPIHFAILGLMKLALVIGVAVCLVKRLRELTAPVAPEAAQVNQISQAVSTTAAVGSRIALRGAV
ncbi:MAG: hypothetical protein ACREIT_09575 [Tepidisphaeraceae bacterium]